MPPAQDITIGRSGLPGSLVVPDSPKGLVVFAHGSGSSRHSPRNVHAAKFLEQRGFGALLFDLLTESEGANRRNVFDIPLLAARVVEAIDWCKANAQTSSLALGLFGASTGAGAAIMAASVRPDAVAAIVSRGGRPDLAGEALMAVRAPTLLIVGGEDHDVLALNVRAKRMMVRCTVELAVIPGAGHLFEEHGTLDLALASAGAWFAQHLQRVAS